VVAFGKISGLVKVGLFGSGYLVSGSCVRLCNVFVSVSLAQHGVHAGKEQAFAALPGIQPQRQIRPLVVLSAHRPEGFTGIPAHQWIAPTLGCLLIKSER